MAPWGCATAPSTSCAKSRPATCGSHAWRWPRRTAPPTATSRAPGPSSSPIGSPTTAPTSPWPGHGSTGAPATPSRARARLLATAQLARRHARLDIHDQALTYAGILDLLSGDAEAALSPLERARAGALDRRADARALDLTLLLAHAHASLGRTEDLRMELDQAARLAQALPSSDMGYFARLVALRLAPDLEPVDAAEPDDPGAASLIQARRALAEGDRARARALTARAVAQGTLEARLAEETRLMLAELGEPVPAGAPLQPPHPPLTRFVTRQWVDARMAAMSQEGHEVRGASGGPDAEH